MNSYLKQRSMSNNGTRTKQTMSAYKLMAIENEYYRHNDALLREITRLRGEVGILAKRYNNAKREINDLVKRVREQPPLAIPERTEKGKEGETKVGEKEKEPDVAIEEAKVKKNDYQHQSGTQLKRIEITDTPRPVSTPPDRKSPVQTHLEANSMAVCPEKKEEETVIFEAVVKEVFNGEAWDWEKMGGYTQRCEVGERARDAGELFRGVRERNGGRCDPKWMADVGKVKKFDYLCWLYQGYGEGKGYVDRKLLWDGGRKQMRLVGRKKK